MEHQSGERPEENQPETTQKIERVDINLINVPRERVTSVWDAELEEEFTASIQAKGILEPVSLMDVNGALWLVDGLHRLLAAEKLKIPKIPAVIKKGSTSDLCIENIIRNRQRGKSNPAQEAETLAFLVNKQAYPLETAAKQLGFTVDWAKKLLRIADLPDEAKDLIKHGKVPITGAFYLCDLPNPLDQLQVAKDAATYGYNVYQIKTRVWQKLNPDQEPQQGEYTFNQEGKPQRIPLRCAYCNTELPPTGAPYIWVCQDCEKLTHALYSGYQEAEKEQQQQTGGET